MVKKCVEQKAGYPPRRYIVGNGLASWITELPLKGYARKKSRKEEMKNAELREANQISEDLVRRKIFS